MAKFLIFYSSTNPSVHHEASLWSFIAVNRLDRSLTLFSEPKNLIYFKILKWLFFNFFSTFYALFPHFDGPHSQK